MKTIKKLLKFTFKWGLILFGLYIGFWAAVIIIGSIIIGYALSTSAIDAVTTPHPKRKIITKSRITGITYEHWR